jgi:hypothetical protein
VRVSSGKSLPDRIKKNPLVAMLALLATTVIGVSAFSDSARNLFGLVHEATILRVAGTWITPVLTNSYDPTIHYHLVLDLRENGKGIGGSLTYFDERRKNDGDRQPILDGKVVDGVVSFRAEWMDGDDQKTHSDFYEGRMSGDEIEFETWNDAAGGSDVQKFKASRQTK